MICPRCQFNELEEHNAISRRDNHTEICTECGMEEAFIDANMVELLPDDLTTVLTRENGFRRQRGLATL